jgi:uncharacterized protein (TIGR02145 family)/uncharacterized repeat protein (TIGR02543 family)
MDGNKTLTANFEALTYTLETGIATIKGGPSIDFWEQNGDVTRNPNKGAYTYNEQVTVTATPASGYTFAYWAGAASGTTATVTITMNDNKSLTAYFQEVQQTQYTLTTNASPSNGGSVSRNPNQTTYAPGTNVTVTATPANGYTFSGWQGAMYSTNATVTITMNDNKILTAYFQEVQQTQYTLTTNATPTNGGSVSRNPDQTTYAPGTSVTVTATPANGYTFKGWSGASSSTNATVTITMNDNKTLTAGFGLPDAKQFTIYFNTNGATDGAYPPETIVADSGKDITLPGQQTMVKTGCRFGGWTINSLGTGIIYIANASYTVTSGVTMYAKWIPLYTVTFSGNGTTGGVPDAVVNVDSGAGITLPEQGSMTRTGYNYGGWNTNTAGTGINYDANTSYTVNSNVTLFAKWIPIYTVTFSGNGATGNIPEAVSVNSGTNITLPAHGSMARTGYNFGGWNTNTAGTGINYDANTSYTVTGNITLYAKWIVAYTLTTNVFPLGGGTVSRNPSADRYNIGTDVTVTATAADGYTFQWWIEGKKIISKSVKLVITMNDNRRLEADFLVTPPGGFGTLTDSRDGKSYKTVVIGGKEWMAENLNYHTISGSWCLDNNSSNCDTYGQLYNWNTAMAGASSSTANPSGVRGVCPSGWHLPSDLEWRDLITFAGGTSTAAKKLKSTSGWSYYGSGDGTDDYGFSALPGGDRGYDGNFGGAGGGGTWWTATSSADGAYGRIMYYNSDSVDSFNGDKSYGWSVRCVGD